MRTTTEDTAKAYEAYMAAGESFTPVYAMYPDTPRTSIRRRIYEHRRALEVRAHRNAPPIPSIEYDDEDAPDGAVIWQRAVEVSERKLAPRNRPALAFPYGPVCIAFTADWHLGSEGTDYARLEDELGLIRDTPGMYAALVGDAVDNFILGKLLALRMGTVFKVTEEWAMARYALEMIAPKLLFVVGGNHDAWTARAAGVDYLADVVQRIAAVPYDSDELTLDVSVGAQVYTIRARHKWRYTSYLNPTHGIEQASRLDKGRGFDVGVGAHTHVSGLSREFNNGGKTGIAVLCGAYKRADEFAHVMGFPAPNSATAVAAIFTEDGILGTSNLWAAAAYMRELYEGGDDEE